jgi:hypothetical protein
MAYFEGEPNMNPILLMSHCVFPTPDIIQTAQFMSKKWALKPFIIWVRPSLTFACTVIKPKSF